MPDLGGGFCGYHATQLWRDYWLWEQILNDAPKLAAIVELGTAYGGCSLYLCTQARNRGMQFHTFDSIDHRTAPLDQCFGRPAERPPIPLMLDRHFQRVELIEDGPVPQVTSVLETRPTVLFCDNGHKAQEVALYAPFLLPGSLCVVHDWKTEIFPADIPDFLVERYGDICDEIGSMSRVFVRS